MPQPREREYVLVVTQETRIRVRAASTAEVVKFVEKAEKDPLLVAGLRAGLQGSRDGHVEILGPGDPTVTWVEGQPVYRLVDGELILVPEGR